MKIIQCIYKKGLDCIRWHGIVIDSSRCGIYHRTKNKKACPSCFVPLEGLDAILFGEG